jgi:RNA polymerase sigma-70 factor (ECF subfamily)
MTGSYDTAEELVQEGFVKAIEHWDTLKSLAFHQQRAWLYQTIKHLFIDSVRKK